MPVFERMPARRVVARPEALDRAKPREDTLMLRVAPDEVLLFPDVDIDLGDPHALSLSETGFSGVWLEVKVALNFLERTCTWQLPSERPAFAQGAVAELPVKLYFEKDRVLILIPAPYAADFEERFKATQ